jgi:anti-sigma regulatory factor (Ser/Thr protein kinase)
MPSGPHAAPAPCAGHAVVEKSEFPGTGEHIAGVRQRLRAVLAACPAADDAVLLASELATNALVHSASGHGGSLIVTVSHREADVRVEVADQGGPWAPALTDDGLHGRGLQIVASLARAWGISGDETGRVAWFEMDCR